VKTLALNLSTISNELCARSFISESTCKEIRTQGVSDEDKAGKLVDNILNQIELKPAKWSELIDILNYDRSHSSIVEKLEDTLKGLWFKVLVA
jgi:hypothetical protein